jgi:hypothetical protein
MPLDESRDFHPEPRTQSDYLSALWLTVGIIDTKVSAINGRVGKLERAMWAMGGGMVVVAAILVPLFLNLLTK